MSSDIIIFQSSDEVEYVVKDHRDIEYEKLLNDFGVQNAYHVENVLDMNEKLSALKSYWISSNILSILAKQVITYAIPIIKEIPKAVDLNKETVNIEIKDKDFFIQLQVNHEIHGFFIDQENELKKIVIPSETPFRITGIKMPKILIPHIDYTSLATYNPFIVDIVPLMLGGSYSYEMVAKTKSNISPFTEQILDIIKQDGNSYEDIYFENAQSAKEILESLLQNILRVNEYFRKFMPLMIRTRRATPIKSDIYSQLPKQSTELPKEIADLFFHPYISKDGFREKLMGEDLWVLYNKIQKIGATNQEINAQIQEKKLSNKIKLDLIKQKKELSFQIVDDFRKQAIVNKKFPGKNLKDLKTKEKEIVMKEFDILKARDKFLKDPKIKEAVHIFLQAFEQINTENALKKSYDEIREIVKNGPSLLEIGLCDHYMKHAELLLEGYKDKSIYKAKASFEIREKIINEFTNSDTTMDEEYYCKLCGQLIAQDSNSEVVEFIGETRIDSGFEADALNELIYRDVSHVMRTFVKFRNLPPDLRPIIKSMVNTLTPEMHLIETKLKQIQTNISDDMRDLIGMYIYIYTFALVSHMIFVNYGQITFAFREGALGGSQPPRSSKFKRSSLIQSTDSDTDSDSDSETIRSINKKLSKSTNNLLVNNNEEDGDSADTESSDGGLVVVKGGDDNEFGTNGGDGDSGENAQERLQNILKNALYLIIMTKVKMLKASSNIGPDKVKPILLQAYQWVLKLQTFKETAVKETDVNYEILTSVITSSIYNYLWTIRSLKYPKTKFEDTKSVIGYTVDQIREVNYKSKKDKINPFKTAEIISEKDWKKSGYEPYDQYTYGSYLQSVSYEKEEKYKYHVTPLEEPLVKHYENAKKLLTIEQRLRFQSRYMHNNRTFNNIPQSFHYTNAQDIKFNIGRFYRPDGSKRKWDTMVLVGKDKKEIEMKIDDLKKMDYSERKSLKIIDRKDGEDYLNDVKDYTTEINKKFETIDYNKSVLEYFENRCPESGIHEFENSDICKKCSRDMQIKWIDTPEATTYIKKYSPEFQKNVNLKSSLVKHNLAKLLKGTVVNEFKFTEFPKLEYTEVQILEWSRITEKININMILNLGCSEGKKYLLIEKERENPVKTYENEHHLGRINKLDSYYNSIIRDYYLVKNSHMAEYPPYYYKDLVLKYKAELQKLPELKDNEYDKKLQWYKIAHHNEAHLICNFILIQIANIIIFVSNIAGYGKMFADLLSSSLIYKDKMFSKPDPFKITIEKRTKDNEYASDSSSEGSDLTDASSVDNIGSFEAESDDNEQKKDTEAYNFGLEDSAIAETNDGNDDDEESGVDQDAPNV